MGFALNQVLHAGEEPVPVGMGSSIVAPCGAYPTADGQTAVLGITSDREWRRLTRDLLGRPELADDPRYAHNADRVRHRAELDQLAQNLVRRARPGRDPAPRRRRRDRQRPAQRGRRPRRAPAARGARTLAAGGLPGRARSRAAAAGARPRLGRRSPAGCPRSARTPRPSGPRSAGGRRPPVTAHAKGRQPVMLSAEEQAVVETVADWVDRRGPARRPGPGARQRLPGGAHRADEADGHLRAGDPRAVGRRAGVDALLRAGDRRAVPRLDEPGRRDGRAHRGGQAAARVRHQGAAGPLPAEDGDRGDPRDHGAHRARRRFRPAGDDDDGPPRRRGLRRSTGPRPGSPMPAGPG